MRTPRVLLSLPLSLALACGACGGSVEETSAVSPQPKPEGGTTPVPVPQPVDGGGPDGTVVGPEAGVDCGAMLCVDCACQCPGGEMIPYGGCFNDCQPIPAELLQCTMDCAPLCESHAPQPCTGGKQCPPGLVCVTPPCDDCYEPPMPICLPEPCESDGCYVDQDCQAGQACVGAAIKQAKFGQCLPELTAPQCWVDSDCPDKAWCANASHCPVCVECGMPMAPGTCAPQPGQEAVVLWVEDDSYYTQEPIEPVWFNLTALDIYLPGCATYDLEGLKGTVWTNLGPTVMCGWEGIAVKVPALGAHTAHPSVIDLGSAYGSYDRYRFRGHFYEGCLDDEPISQAQCTGSHEILSREFLVQWPLD